MNPSEEGPEGGDGPKGGAGLLVQSGAECMVMVVVLTEKEEASGPGMRVGGTAEEEREGEGAMKARVV